MSFQTVEQLQATVAEQALEIKRLTGCLAKANANHEHFEREWYLSGDQIASLTAEIERLRSLVEDAYYEGNNDAVYGYGRDWLGSDSAAALQPKEEK